MKRQDPEVAKWVQVLKEKYAGMKLVVARDKMDYIKGVRQKMLAFERFLIMYPEYLGKVTKKKNGWTLTKRAFLGFWPFFLFMDIVLSYHGCVCASPAFFLTFLLLLLSPWLLLYGRLSSFKLRYQPRNETRNNVKYRMW